MLSSRFKSTAFALSLATSMGVGLIAAQAATYTIDPSHSFIKFETNHLGFSKLSGEFNKFSGTLNYDPEAGAAAQQVKVEIDTASIDTNWADRDKHLRSGDFFDVSKFTTAVFESTGYQGDANGGTLTGNLTLLGVTKEVSFPIVKIGEGKDPWGGYRVGFEGKYTLTRKDFGMDFNVGPKAETVDVTLQIEAIKDK
ncbi:MAG: YceI family protein [Pseudomonadota bacterium]